MAGIIVRQLALIISIRLFYTIIGVHTKRKGVKIEGLLKADDDPTWSGIT